MIIVDSALAARAEAGNPVRVGMIGAGFMARGIANSILHSFPGMRLVAVANRTLPTAIRAYTEAGAAADDIETVATVAGLEDAIRAGRYAVTDDPMVVAEAPIGRGDHRGHRDDRVCGARRASGRSSMASTSS